MKRTLKKNIKRNLIEYLNVKRKENVYIVIRIMLCKKHAKIVNKALNLKEATD